MTSPYLVDLLSFLDGSPSPYHAVATTAAELTDADFVELDERQAWPREPGRFFIRRGGSLVAWAVGANASDVGFRIVGAHTDSPNLRVKPNADTAGSGFLQVGVEVYGSALYNSWLDRDLGVSGRLTVRSGDDLDDVLVRVDDIGLRVPQLAIHLDREVNTRGLVVNPQTQLSPIWGLGRLEGGRFIKAIAERAGLEADAVVAHDLMLHDVTPARVVGAEGEFLASARIDNLLSCHAGLVALLGAAETDIDATVPLLCLFDHEEIGSTSSAGAASSMLPTVIERIVDGVGGDRVDLARALARSACASADGAHATHPNYTDRHDPDHQVSMDGGPVVKHNANVRYATDGPSAAAFILACERSGIGHQDFAMRSDMACGSTIGPVTAAILGISTVDVGVAQLSMHSAREMCGSADPERFSRALQAFLAPD